MKYSPQKSIFQIRYDPKLCFYDKLYKNDKLADKFPHWQTDRLRVTLRDFDKKYSITIAHDNTFFESDMYHKQSEEEMISLLISEISNFVDDGTFSRFGFRRYYLIDKEMSFPELVEIINLKYFTNYFKKIFEDQINDSTITIISSINGNDFRLMLGPMKKKGIPNFIKYNIENHIDPEPNKRVQELSKIFKNYPDIALFLDIDYYLTGKGLKKDSLEKFWETSKKDIPQIIGNITSNLFEEKLKK